MAQVSWELDAGCILGSAESRLEGGSWCWRLDLCPATPHGGSACSPLTLLGLEGQLAWARQQGLALSGQKTPS